jgi:hypothetical protein
MTSILYAHIVDGWTLHDLMPFAGMTAIALFISYIDHLKQRDGYRE